MTIYFFLIHNFFNIITAQNVFFILKNVFFIF